MSQTRASLRRIECNASNVSLALFSLLGVTARFADFPIKFSINAVELLSASFNVDR